MKDNNTTQKDEAVKMQDKSAQDSSVKAAELNKEAARGHEKQADKQAGNSNS